MSCIDLQNDKIKVPFNEINEDQSPDTADELRYGIDSIGYVVYTIYGYG